MYLVPYLKKKFEYSLPVTEVMDMLKKIVADDTVGSSLTGKFEGDTFELRGSWTVQERYSLFSLISKSQPTPIRRRKSLLAAIAMGKLESVGDGSILTLEVGPRPTNLYLPLFFCAAILAIGYHGYSIGDYHMVAWAIGFVSMLYVVNLIVFNYFADRYVQFIAELPQGKAAGSR